MTQIVPVKLVNSHPKYTEEIIPCSLKDTIEDLTRRAQKIRISPFGEHALFLKRTPKDRGRWILNWMVTLGSLSITFESQIHIHKKYRVQKCVLLNGTENLLLIDETRPVQEVARVVATKVNISEDFLCDFSLRNPKGKENEWFDPELSLREQGFDFENDSLLLDKKLFFRDNDLNQSHVMELILTFLKAKQKYLDGLNCTREEVIRMTALLHKIDEKEELDQLIPIDFREESEKLKTKIKAHSEKLQISEQQAQLDFVKLCASKPYYYYTFYQVKDTTVKRDILLGVSSDTLLALSIPQKTKVYSIDRRSITNWKETPSTIQIYLRNKSVLELVTEQARYLGVMMYSVFPNQRLIDLSTTEPSSIKELLKHEKTVSAALEGLQAIEKQFKDYESIPLRELNLPPGTRSHISSEESQLLSEIITISASDKLVQIDKMLFQERNRILQLAMNDSVVDEIEELPIGENIKALIREHLERIKRYDDFVNLGYRCLGKRHKKALQELQLLFPEQHKRLSAEHKAILEQLALKQQQTSPLPSPKQNTSSQEKTLPSPKSKQTPQEQKSPLPSPKQTTLQASKTKTIPSPKSQQQENQQEKKQDQQKHSNNDSTDEKTQIIHHRTYTKLEIVSKFEKKEGLTQKPRRKLSNTLQATRPSVRDMIKRAESRTVLVPHANKPEPPKRKQTAFVKR